MLLALFNDHKTHSVTKKTYRNRQLTNDTCCTVTKSSGASRDNFYSRPNEFLIALNASTEEASKFLGIKNNHRSSLDQDVILDSPALNCPNDVRFLVYFRLWDKHLRAKQVWRVQGNVCKLRKGSRQGSQCPYQRLLVTSVFRAV